MAAFTVIVEDDGTGVHTEKNMAKTAAQIEANAPGSVTWTNVTDKPSVFAPDTHAHAESDVTSLTTDLAAKETPAGAQGKVDTHAGLIAAHGAGAQCLTSDFTTASTTPVSTNLTFAIAANEVFVVDVFGTCKKVTSATGMKFAIAAPTGCTIAGFQLGGAATLAALPVPSLITAINTLGTVLATGTNIQVTFALRFRVVNGANAGAITLQAATVTSNTLTIYAGAAMFYQRATAV
jgi:hypothetical protein